MSKKLLPIYLFLMITLIGCHESTSNKMNQTMDVPMSSTQNNKDWLLTEDEARAALLKMEEKIRIQTKLAEVAQETRRKWYREHDGLLPDSLRDALFELEYGIKKQREIFEKYGDVNFEEFFKDFIIIKYEIEVDFETEYTYELAGIGIEEKIYLWKWECDLKEGLFRSPIPEENTGWPDYGRFIKDEDGEWTAIIVVHGGWDTSHGNPRGGFPREDAQPE